MPPSDPANILVIRLGALGDFVQSFGPFAAIRAHHPAARITLLTTAPYAKLAQAAPWFDAVLIDARPALHEPGALRTLRRHLQGHDLVYDLQTSRRSTSYFWLAGCPPWSGIGAFRRFPHRDPARDVQHTLERQRGQLPRRRHLQPPAAGPGLAHRPPHPRSATPLRAAGPRRSP